MNGLMTVTKIMLALAIIFSLANIVFTFRNGSASAKPATLELIDKYCNNSTAYFVVRNGGDAPLTKYSMTCVKNDAGCIGECVVDNLQPSSAGYVKVYNCSSGEHSFKLTGTTNVLYLDASCS